jgi:hypothetical protein
MDRIIPPPQILSGKEPCEGVTVFRGDFRFFRWRRKLIVPFEKKAGLMSGHDTCSSGKEEAHC